MTPSNIKSEYEELKSDVYNSYQKNKVTEEYDYDSYRKYVANKGVREYDIEGLTDLFIRGGLESDEYFFLRDRWRNNMADAK